MDEKEKAELFRGIIGHVDSPDKFLSMIGIDDVGIKTHHFVGKVPLTVILEKYAKLANVPIGRVGDTITWMFDDTSNVGGFLKNKLWQADIVGIQFNMTNEDFDYLVYAEYGPDKIPSKSRGIHSIHNKGRRW